MDLDLKFLLEEVGPWEWPRGLKQKLLPILKDKNGTADKAQRLAAVEMAGDLTQMNNALAGALLSIVENLAESEEIRAKAAVSFGAVLEVADIDQFDDPESVPISEERFNRIQGALRKVYLDTNSSKLLQRRILEGSIRAPEEWHTAEIRKAYATGDPEWMLTAVFCMSHVRGFDKEVLESLDSKNADIHYEAVRAAGAFEMEAGWQHIADLARSERTEKNLRIAAIEALSTLKPHDSLEILIELSGHRDEDIAEAAQEAETMAVGFLEIGKDDDEFDDDDQDEDDDLFDEKSKPLT